MLVRCADAARLRSAQRVLERFPPLAGLPIQIESAPGLRDRHGEVHAGAFLRERRIAFNCTGPEFARVFAHELFHFVWLRLGNPTRVSYERLLAGEGRDGAAGELGWSAEWRKRELQPRDGRERTRRWREYCCESFCDTAAWLYSGVEAHPEFTLSATFRRARRQWFQRLVAQRGRHGGLSI